MEKTQAKPLTAAQQRQRDKKRRTWLRAGVQLFFFVSMPGAFVAGFSGVKQLFLHIGAGEVLSADSFTLSLLGLCGFTLLFDRFFCGYACAFGSLGDAVWALSGPTAIHSSLSAWLMNLGLIRHAGERWLTPAVDGGRCVACGLCARICPVSNIICTAKGAVIGSHCSHCLACVHWCPQQAVTVHGKQMLSEDQYHHPDVTAEDMMRRRRPWPDTARKAMSRTQRERKRPSGRIAGPYTRPRW